LTKEISTRANERRRRAVVDFSRAAIREKRVMPVCNSEEYRL